MLEPIYNNSTHAYMQNTVQFLQWSPSHIWALVVSILSIVFIPVLSKKYLSLKQQQIVGSAIGIMVFSSYLIWMYLEYAAGTWDYKKHLPLHLCRFSNMAIVLVMVWRKKWWFEILYFWALGGMLQATITPDLMEDFPHFMYFRFWIAHPGMILAIIYASVVYGFRPEPKHIIKAMIGVNVFLVVAAITNIILGTNYFWICGKPPTASILDHLGPWPWYVFFAEFVALANFSLAYLPWVFIDYFNKKNSFC